MQHSMLSIGILGSSVGMLNECAHTVDVFSQLVDTRTEHSPFHLNAILIAIKDRVNRHLVAIGHAKIAHFELIHVEHRSAFTRSTQQPNRFFIRIAGKTTGIAQQRAHAFVAPHLIGHRTFHRTLHINQAVIRPYNDDIIVVQPDVTHQTTIENIIIHIDHRHQTPTTINLDVAQCAQLVDAASHVKRMENTGKSTNRIGARHLYFAHHVHNDGARLPHSGLNLTAAETRSQRAAYLIVGRSHRHAAHSNGTIAWNGHGSFRRNHQRLGLLRSAKDVNHHFITRTDGVVGGCGNVHVGLEAQQLIIKNVAAKHLSSIGCQRFCQQSCLRQRVVTLG